MKTYRLAVTLFASVTFGATPSYADVLYDVSGNWEFDYYTNLQGPYFIGMTLSENNLTGQFVGTDANGGTVSGQVVPNSNEVGIFDSSIGGLGVLTLIGYVQKDQTILGTIHGKTGFEWSGRFFTASGKVTVNPVPEPSTYILFGTGLLGVCMVSRSRLSKTAKFGGLK